MSTHSWKAQHRLHKLFRRIEAKRGSRIAVVAVARELAGFLWAVLQDIDATTPHLIAREDLAA